MKAFAADPCLDRPAATRRDPRDSCLTGARVAHERPVAESFAGLGALCRASTRLLLVVKRLANGLSIPPFRRDPLARRRQPRFERLCQTAPAASILSIAFAHRPAELRRLARRDCRGAAPFTRREHSAIGSVGRLPLVRCEHLVRPRPDSSFHAEAKADRVIGCQFVAPEPASSYSSCR
jgi:hypothetical protein